MWSWVILLLFLLFVYFELFTYLPCWLCWFPLIFLCLCWRDLWICWCEHVCCMMFCGVRVIIVVTFIFSFELFRQLCLWLGFSIRLLISCPWLLNLGIVGWTVFDLVILIWFFFTMWTVVWVYLLILHSEDVEMRILFLKSSGNKFSIEIIGIVLHFLEPLSFILSFKYSFFFHFLSFLGQINLKLHIWCPSISIVFIKFLFLAVWIRKVIS